MVATAAPSRSAWAYTQASATWAGVAPSRSATSRTVCAIFSLASPASPAKRGLVREDRADRARRSEEHTSELQSPCNLVCRLLLEKKKDLGNHTHVATTTNV